MRVSTAMLNRQSVNDMIRQPSEISAVQANISSGKRVNSPKDDPAQAGRLLNMAEADARLAQFDRNSISAEARLSLEETALTGVNDSLLRIRDLVLTANNSTLDSHSHSAIHAEVTQRLDALYDLANVRDSNGDFLFSGSNGVSRPFTQGGSTVYNGNDDTRVASIGLGESIQTGDSGADVFVRIKEGNGIFAVNADVGNTGTGIMSTGSLVDPSAYVDAAHSIVFTSGTTFDIVDSTSGATIQTGIPFVESDPISFNGIELNLRGVPATGDVFDVAPSQFKDIFSTVSDFATALAAPAVTASDKASQSQTFNSVLANLDQSLEHINTIRSRVGTRLTSIDSRREENNAVSIQLQQARSNIEDLDITKAVTELQTRVNSLEILQQSYAAIDNLSLFNYM